MRAPEKLLADLLKLEPNVAQLVGDRVFPVVAPASAAMPFINWRRVNVQREMAFNGPVGMPTVTMAFDIYADSYEAVRDLADRVRTCLDGWGGAVGNSLSVQLVSLQSESDGYIQLAGGDLPPAYSVQQTYTVLWGQEN